MSAQLDFYAYDKTTQQNIKLDGSIDMGDIFKGASETKTLKIYNSGNSVAVKPVLNLLQYEDSIEPLKWKGLSFSPQYDFTSSLEFPNVEAGEWAKGKDIYFEDFDQYNITSAAPIAGPEWNSDHDINCPDLWKVYAKDLYYYGVDLNTPGIIQQAKTLNTRQILKPKSIRWGAAKDFYLHGIFTVMNNGYMGFVLRDHYLVLLSAVQDFIDPTTNPTPYTLQLFYHQDPITSALEPSGWRPLAVYNIGNVCNQMDFWVQIQDEELNGIISPVFKFWISKKGIEEEPSFTYTLSLEEQKTCSFSGASIPGIIGYERIEDEKSTNRNSNMKFSDLKMIVPNEIGLIYLKSSVPSETKLYGMQHALLNLDYGSSEK